MNGIDVCINLATLNAIHQLNLPSIMESLASLIIILIASIFGAFGIQFILTNIDGSYKTVKRYSKELVVDLDTKKDS